DVHDGGPDHHDVHGADHDDHDDRGPDDDHDAADDRVLRAVVRRGRLRPMHHLGAGSVRRHGDGPGLVHTEPLHGVHAHDDRRLDDDHDIPATPDHDHDAADHPVLRAVIRRWGFRSMHHGHAGTVCWHRDGSGLVHPESLRSLHDYDDRRRDDDH